VGAHRSHRLPPKLGSIPPLVLCSPGIVRSPVSATLPQVLSRLFLVWGILYPAPEVRGHFLVLSLVLSWSITEVSTEPAMISV